MQRPEPIVKCPICGQAEMLHTGQVACIGEILARWAQVVGPEAAATYDADYEAESALDLVLSRCGVCGFGRFAPPIPGTARFYEAISRSAYYTEEKWEFAQAIRDLAALGANRILDVGCGSGYFLKQVRAACPNMVLTGYDANAALMAGLAAEGFETLGDPFAGVPVGTGDPASFDVICLFQVLEHVADPLAFISAFVSLLKPGGSMIITTPNAAGPIRYLPEALTELPPHHLTQWTEAAFRALLPRFGLGVSLVRYEPLPDYLWATYLPLVWSEGVWPALVFDPLALSLGLETTQARVSYAMQRLKALGLKSLAGVPGHTVYVLAHHGPGAPGSAFGPKGL